jgi:Icc-related predicted phosphoesterase
MIRIAHCSDTHDRPSTIRQVADLDVDLLLITGDCMNNLGRVQRTGGIIRPSFEVKYQESWYRKQAKKWAADLKGRPVIAIRGNHDFIGYSRWLRHYGVTVFEITDENPVVEVMGKRWAGFRQVNYMMGEWCGEERDLTPFVEAAFECDPDILVTHAPPAGILDTDTHGEKGYGISPLTTALCYRPHRITHHFFGHAHGSGGQMVEEMGITFANGAGRCIVHEIP